MNSLVIVGCVILKPHYCEFQHPKGIINRTVNYMEMTVTVKYRPLGYLHFILSKTIEKGKVLQSDNVPPVVTNDIVRHNW